MLADYAGISVPTFPILNMSDVAAEQGKKIDADAISKKHGIPLVLFSAQDKKNYDNFFTRHWKSPLRKNSFERFCS